MVNNLRGFTIVKTMRDYLRRICYQDNSARKFQLELDIGNYHQGNLSIEQFYSGFINLWSDYFGLVHSQVPKEALVALQAVHSESQRDQFLMKLRPEFESARDGLINRTPVLSWRFAWVNSCVKNNVSPHSLALLKMLVVLRWLMWPTLLKAEDDLDLRHSVIVARNLGTLQNIATRNSSTFVPTSSALPAVPGSSSNITPEQVQQMIISSLSALGLQGKKHLLTSPWLIDSVASNHITGSPTALHDVHKYDGSSVGTGDNKGA
ncbi:hypothetical protein F0562_003480 [Nyssa sinensis]|uniref:Retrotransposon gag domain-containing protein n=1 Tax=Nyssa sinensis TaxID=561372 RepID=A0A5J5C0V6_9ASTE|nr:hypothetical protein F0562_003480 [Nyssa sinensis]